MRRVLTTALTAALFLGITAAGLPGSSAEPRPAYLNTAMDREANQQEWRERTCRFQWLQRGTWTAREERRTALCILERWDVPGGWPTFNRVIDCESGWGRFAYNPSGPYVGLGQHVLSAWPARLHSYSPSKWDLRARWQNSRSMLTVTARMMHHVGLSPWSCA